MMKTKTEAWFVLASSALVGLLALVLILGSPAHAQTTYTTTTTTTTTATTNTLATTTPQAINPNIILCEINRGLTLGSSGEDVRCLQRYLNQAGFMVATIGPGSPGNETIYFGQLTRQAVIRWQNAHRIGVLVPLGLTAGTGFWGNSSQNYYSALVRIALGVAFAR